MGDFYLDISLFVVLLGAVIGLVFWLLRRKEQKANRAHAEALKALAGRLGGTVIGSAEATAWSAELCPPFARDAEGLINRLGTVRRPRFESALDFRQGSWRVRVSEASMKKNTSAGTRTFSEHRIEVATAQLAPMKICRRLHTDFHGRPLRPDHPATQAGPAREVPVSVAQRPQDWLQAGLPAPADHEFVAFTSDLPSAARMLNPEAVEWLVEHAGSLPVMLTFEAGLLYATLGDRIDPNHLQSTVGAILGLLDRIPGATPAHPTATT
jgi:hypothetical protein